MDLEQTAKEIEVGRHVLECINTRVGQPSRNTGAECRIFDFIVVDGDSEGCTISERFYLNDTGKKFMARMLLRLGLGGSFDETKTMEYYFNMCAGKRIVGEVKERTYNDRTFKAVDRFHPLTKNDKQETEDIPRLAAEEYEPPKEQETGGSAVGDDEDIPF